MKQFFVGFTVSVFFLTIVFSVSSQTGEPPSSVGWNLLFMGPLVVLAAMVIRAVASDFVDWIISVFRRDKDR